MSEKIERLLNDFCDVVDALSSSRIGDERFRNMWLDKKRNVVKRIEELNEEDHKNFEKEYKNWVIYKSEKIVK
jgi:hypothetical protein